MSRRIILFAGLGLGVLLLFPAVKRLRPWWRQRAVESAPQSPDVVLVTMDTTRADRLEAYGGEPGTTPALDSLAAAGVVFQRAYTHVPITLAAHASILTGLTPAHHGVHNNATFVLAPGFPTLAEAFSRAGYRTAAFVSAVVLDRQYGLSRGFDHYE